MESGKLSSPGAERLVALQLLRAAAAVAVVLAHISAFATGAEATQGFPNFFMGNAGVDVFFIISGFTMVYTTCGKFGRPGASLDFAWRRIVRVVPIYWLVTTWYLWMQHAPNLSMALANMQSSVANMIASYLFLPIPRTNGTQAPVLLVGWTLNYEMFFYAVFAVALLFSRRIAALACMSLFLLGLTLMRPFLQSKELGMLAFWANPLVLEFVMGMWLAVAYGRGWRVKPIVAAIMLVVGFVVFHYAKSNGAQEFVRVYDWGLASLLIVASCLLVKWPTPQSSRIGRVARGMILIGDASYVLYLTHLYVILMPRKYLGLDPATSPWAFAAASLAFSITAAVGIHLLLEKPLTRVMRAAPVWFTKYGNATPVVAAKAN